IIERKTTDRILVLFVFLCFATAMGSFIYYIMHFKEVTESYKHAKTIPVVIEHIRYSLMLTIAFFCSIVLYISSPIIKTPLTKKIITGMGLFIFIFLHILSIRSGLLALYATAFIWLLVMIIQKRDKRFLLLIPAALVFPVIMYWFVPSLHNKVEYMVRDITRFASGKSVNNYSDGNRLLSMKIGTEIGLEHPVLGVGSGDVEQEMNKAYETQYPDIDPHNRLIPHNQFVYIFTALGFTGLFIFIICLLLPVFTKEIFTDVFCLSVLVSSYSSFLSEATLEVQQGIVLVSLLFSLAYIRIYSKG
ncbi:MAG: O-antigen ligase family protein, partial [Cytophagales bacterium]|nr:O-antigen ligase family protein [Cytophaga sp.]